MGSFRRWWWLVLVILLLAVAGFVIWAGAAAAPMPEALVAMEGDSEVEVEAEQWLEFQPLAKEPTAGLILYPGARIDPRAYAPAARALALEGYLVLIVPMPLNLAVFGADRATDVVAAFPEVEHWAVGGHSLGGAMAARYVFRNPQMADGLVLWAAYPASSDDLSGHDLAVSSIYGTLDGLSTVEEIVASRPLLPHDTRWVAIEGGDHAQFGWYGPQAGDNAASISREAQQAQIVAATLELLSEIETQAP
jgi:pimeloyl-ACP methyl ester carboxylesterase